MDRKDRIYLSGDLSYRSVHIKFERVGAHNGRDDSTKAVHDETAANASKGTVTTAESGNRMPLTRYVTLLFAIACGMSVANIYFAQPRSMSCRTSSTWTMPSLEF